MLVQILGRQEKAIARPRRCAMDLDVEIIDASTGELVRYLTIDPTRDYQPRPVPLRTPTK